MNEAGPGHAVFQGTPQPKHLDPMAVVPVLWFATLPDFALGTAVLKSVLAKPIHPER